MSPQRVPNIRLSLVIPCKDVNDRKLKELLASIEAQDFPKDELETLIITEGTSESAKAIGIRKAKGEVIGILASDNKLIGNDFLQVALDNSEYNGSTYPMYYCTDNLDILGRYFALIGGNDPLAYYIGKNDHLRVDQKAVDYSGRIHEKATYGDNGFFVQKEMIQKTDLENYYHIDNACELEYQPVPFQGSISHNTGGNIFKFFAKRYRYGLQHAFNKNRRWNLVDFRKPKDVWRLVWFILCTLTILEPLCLSIRGYLRIRDIAWFIHPIACLGTVFTYGLLMCHLFCQWMYQLLFAPMVAQKA